MAAQVEKKSLLIRKDGEMGDRESDSSVRETG